MPKGAVLDDEEILEVQNLEGKMPISQIRQKYNIGYDRIRRLWQQKQPLPPKEEKPLAIEASPKEEEPFAAKVEQWLRQDRQILLDLQQKLSMVWELLHEEQGAHSLLGDIDDAHSLLGDLEEVVADRGWDWGEFASGLGVGAAAVSLFSYWMCRKEEKNTLPSMDEEPAPPKREKNTLLAME